jgi:hypothetical protein
MARGRKYVEVLQTTTATVTRKAKVSVQAVLEGDILDRLALLVADGKFGKWHIVDVNDKFETQVYEVD